MTVHTCTRCKEAKPRDQFGTRSKKPHRISWCRSCCVEHSRAYKAAIRDGVRVRGSAPRGLSPEDIAVLRKAFIDGVSVRKSADVIGCCKNTAERYFARFRKEGLMRKRGELFPDAIVQLALEAYRAGVTPTAAARKLGCSKRLMSKQYECFMDLGELRPGISSSDDVAEVRAGNVSADAKFRELMLAAGHREQINSPPPAKYIPITRGTLALTVYGSPAAMCAEG